MDKRDRRQDKRQGQRGKRGFGTLGDLVRRPPREREVRKPVPAPAPKLEDKTRCACGGHMKPRGPVGHAGHLRSKCCKCGATVWTRPPFKPPVPLVPTSKTGFRGSNAHVRRPYERTRTGDEA
jgi:hypothetical protein